MPNFDTSKKKSCNKQWCGAGPHTEAASRGASIMFVGGSMISLLLFDGLRMALKAQVGFAQMSDIRTAIYQCACWSGADA